MIQNLLDELQTTWDFSSEELADIKGAMKHYALAACLDSEVRKEAFKTENKE